MSHLSKLLVPQQAWEDEIERVEKLFLYDKYGGRKPAHPSGWGHRKSYLFSWSYSALKTKQQSSYTVNNKWRSLFPER